MVFIATLQSQQYVNYILDSRAQSYWWMMVKHTNPSGNGHK
jgi:hypothetical protein